MNCNMAKGTMSISKDNKGSQKTYKLFLHFIWFYYIMNDESFSWIIKNSPNEIYVFESNPLKPRHSFIILQIERD